MSVTLLNSSILFKSFQYFYDIVYIVGFAVPSVAVLFFIIEQYSVSAVLLWRSVGDYVYVVELYALEVAGEPFTLCGGNCFSVIFGAVLAQPRNNADFVAVFL